jgi:hypothetical protein
MYLIQNSARSKEIDTYIVCGYQEESKEKKTERLLKQCQFNRYVLPTRCYLAALFNRKLAH